MDMQIHKSGDDQTVTVVPDRTAAQTERQCLIYPVDFSVFTYKISVFTKSKFCLAFTVHNISF